MSRRSGYYLFLSVALTSFGSIFAIEKDDLLPKPMLSFIRFLELTDAEVDHIVEKGRLPKAKPTGTVLRAALEVLQRRLAQYATTVDVRTNRSTELIGWLTLSLAR
jgi:hypothetical protein